MIVLNTLVIGCKTIKDEITRAIANTGCQYEVRWTQGGLHYVPGKLCDAIQEILDGANEFDRVLLANGYCGNTLIGLRNQSAELIIPRVDDCISLMLGSCANKLEILSESKAYFMTEGWLNFERNIWAEYSYCVSRYGQSQADDIFHAMFGNYRSLVLLDTDCFDLDDVRTRTEQIASSLHLEHRVIPGTTSYIERLLKGPWPDEDFLIVPPHTTIDDDTLTLPVNMLMEGGSRIG